MIEIHIVGERMSKFKNNKKIKNFKKKLFSDGQIGDGSETDRLFPVAVDNSGILSENLISLLSDGFFHTCTIYSPQFSCFCILFNDTSVCSGNGK
jgi:hypothetical protein